MAKILLLSTSPRKNGNTMTILAEMAKTIEEKGSEAEIVSFAGKEFRGCKACYACKKLGKCAIDDDANGLILKVKEADGFIIGAPVYFGTARGEAMNFLQRLAMVSYGGERFLKGKVGGPFAVARRGGHTATIQEMLMFFFINGMVVPGADYWNMGFGREPGEVEKDREGMENLKTFAANVADLVEKLK